MAPPRQPRTAAVIDDSRSEASSGIREQRGSGTKGKRAVNGTASANAASSRQTKAATDGSNASKQEAEQSEDVAKIPWTEMNLDILHSYRHAYKLAVPSAFSKEYSRLLLSRGIGMRSPTSLAARQGQQAGQANGTRSAGKHISGSKATPSKNGVRSGNMTPPNINSSLSGINGLKMNTHLNHAIGQARISKEQLAVGVRKHFNSVALAEQEAIARFLYKVREERRDRQFRFRFQS